MIEGFHHVQNILLKVSCFVGLFQGVEAVCTLYQTFQEGSEGLMDTHKDCTRADPGPLRPYPRHMPATERLRKVIQELVDTEKSYVKVLTHQARLGRPQCSTDV